MIQIKKLCKSYYKQVIVDELSLEIKKGTVFGFLGPNGAGKTTTIKMLVGLNPPDYGTVTVNKNDPLNAKTREIIGFMPENPYFYDHLSGLELLQFCDELCTNKPNKNKYSELLKEVGLYDARKNMIKTYSKGMKQRLGLAQAIIHDPDYIFLDEPLDGLDPIGRIEIKKIINKLKKEGKTIFFNSHILADVEEICDQIGIINKGKLIYSGDVKRFCKEKSLEAAFVDAIRKQYNG